MAAEIKLAPGKCREIFGQMMTELNRETASGLIPLGNSQFLAEQAVFSGGRLLILGEDSATDERYAHLFSGVTPEEWQLVGTAYENGVPGACCFL